MTAELQAGETPRDTSQSQDADDRSSSQLRWLAFVASASLVIDLALMRKAILAIYQDYDIQSTQLSWLSLNPYIICVLALVPIVVLVKEFASLSAAKKQLIDSAIILISILLVVAATWAVFNPLKVLVH